MLPKFAQIIDAAAPAERLDPRVLRTRKMLEDAFIDLLWKEGFEALTVRDIAKHAGVNRATFYAHFEDKYALFNHALEKGLEIIVHNHLPPDAHFTAENLTRLVVALIEFFDVGNAGGCSLARNKLMRPMIESRVQEKIAALLLAWIKVTPNLSLRTEPEVTATILSWTLFGLGISYAREQSAVTNQATITTAVEIMLGGALADNLAVLTA